MADVKVEKIIFQVLMTNRTGVNCETNWKKHMTTTTNLSLFDKYFRLVIRSLFLGVVY
jgi:hypothetical protein